MDKYYAIGTIVSTHALKGEIKIFSTTDFREDRYRVGNTLYIEKAGKMIQVKVDSYRPHKNFDLVSFEGYHDINTIMQFLKCKVYVNEENIQDLADEEFYYHQLFDCLVYHESVLIGKVSDVVNYGASDILIIQDVNNHEIMIPFVDDFILDVDIINKKIQIEVIEGLINNED